MRPTHLKTSYRYELSPRQRQVMDLLDRGLTNAEIADRLGVTLDGAKYHVREILGKLGAESREEAVAIWREMPSRERPWARFGGALVGKVAIAAAVAGVALAAAAVVLALAWQEDDSPADQSASPVFTSTPTVTPLATQAPALAECTSLDVTLALETVPRGDDVLVRLSASGTTPCRMLGSITLGLVRPPVTPGPNYPPEANTTRDMKIALDFPFNGVLGEWSWENWCAEPMTWVFWQAKSPGDGPQVGLSNDFWPPCLEPGGPSTLAQVQINAGLDGDVTPDTTCLSAGFEPWLCEFATSVAVDAVAGRQALFPKRISNNAFFLCDGEGSAPGLGVSNVCEGEPANTSVRGYWLSDAGEPGRYVSQPEFENAIRSSLTSSETLYSVACEGGSDTCSRFAINVGSQTPGFGAPRLVLLFRLEGGREPAIVGGLINPPDAFESPFGLYDLTHLSPRE